MIYDFIASWIIAPREPSSIIYESFIVIGSANFHISISSWVCAKICRKRGRKIIIIRGSHNNNSSTERKCGLLP